MSRATGSTSPAGTTRTFSQGPPPTGRRSRITVADGIRPPVDDLRAPRRVTSSPAVILAVEPDMLTAVARPSMSYVVTSPGVPMRIASIENGAPSQPNVMA